MALKIQLDQVSTKWIKKKKHHSNEIDFSDILVKNGKYKRSCFNPSTFRGNTVFSVSKIINNTSSRGIEDSSSKHILFKTSKRKGSVQ